MSEDPKEFAIREKHRVAAEREIVKLRAAQQKSSGDAKRKLCGLLPPKIGSDIYIPTSMYIDRGEDDFCGGLCTVASVKESKANGGDWCVEVVERPGSGYYWSQLSKDQEKLKKEFGEQRGYRDPDWG